MTSIAQYIEKRALQLHEWGAPLALAMAITVTEEQTVLEIEALKRRIEALEAQVREMSQA